MSTNLQDLSPVPLPDDKPSNRGRFSDDRQYWEEVHKRRYLQWQGGDGIEDAIRTLETLPQERDEDFRRLEVPRRRAIPVTGQSLVQN